MVRNLQGMKEVTPDWKVWKYDLMGWYWVILFHDLFMYVLQLRLVDLAAKRWYTRRVLASIGRRQYPCTSLL